MNFEKGQSLIELLVAIGIFVIIVSSLVVFILDSYIFGFLAEEITKANSLAEEGIEAAKSIKDDSWENLTLGDHGLKISGNHWEFQGAPEDISTQLEEGATRVITIENIDADRKKVISRVNWNLGEGRPQEIKIVTYLTNWEKLMPFPRLAQLNYRWRNDDGSE